MKIVEIKILIILLFQGCSPNDKDNQLRCEVIKSVYNNFKEVHKYDLKYMKFEHSYICNFDYYEIDPSIAMDSISSYLDTTTYHFNLKELKDIGKNCLGIRNIKHLNNDEALDSLKNSKSIGNAIWGVTNFKNKNNYYYLIFSLSKNTRTVIGKEYLVEIRNGIPIILKINPISN